MSTWTKDGSAPEFSSVTGVDFDPSTADVTVATWVAYPTCSCGYQGFHSLIGHWVYRWTGNLQLRSLWYRTSWGAVETDTP